MWAGGSMPPAHEVFPIRHTTDDTTTGLGGLWGLIVKERVVKPGLITE